MKKGLRLGKYLAVVLAVALMMTPALSLAQSQQTTAATVGGGQAESGVGLWVGLAVVGGVAVVAGVATAVASSQDDSNNQYSTTQHH
jgi:hypothetical protein